MAVQTQGTKLYTIDPANSALITVGCVTSIDGIDTAIEQVETTCLESSARTYIAGLATPGSASFGIQFDPDDASHVRLHALKTAGTSLWWAIGFSDGTAPPTVGTGGADDFDLPTTRSWILFEGFMNSYPFSFAQNSVVTSTVGIQVSGEPRILPKA
jgi:hypothetical protein